MTVRDIFESTDAQADVIARKFEDIMDWKDTKLTWQNLDAFGGYSINCIIPEKNKLIIEIA